MLPKLLPGQDTVVLGKNVRRSFGRMQDRDPPPTRKTGHRIKIETERVKNWKRNKSTSTPARERPLTRMRARSENWTLVQFGLDLKLVRCE